MTDHDRISAHLRRAARIIRRNGLHQREYYDHDQHYDDKIPLDECRVCGLGAINIAVTGSPSPSRSDAVEEVALHVSNYMAAHRYDTTLPEWNDVPGRTAAQVAILLRRAAAWTAPVEPMAVPA